MNPEYDQAYRYFKEFCQQIDGTFYASKNVEMLSVLKEDCIFQYSVSSATDADFIVPSKKNKPAISVFIPLVDSKDFKIILSKKKPVSVYPRYFKNELFQMVVTDNDYSKKLADFLLVDVEYQNFFKENFNKQYIIEINQDGICVYMYRLIEDAFADESLVSKETLLQMQSLCQETKKAVEFYNKRNHF